MTGSCSVIEVDRVSKSFSIPHEQRTTFKELFLHPMRRPTFEVNAALQELTFDVTEGEMLGIIGPNGSGKSTLLKLIAGIYRPDSGAIRVNGKLSPFIELGVGFNPELNARDNIEVNGTLLGLSRRELESRFDAILAFAELERFVDQKLKNFSSGMLTRLAFSTAIQVPFDILLLDEVLAVGDQSFQEKCYDTFRDMRRAHKTIVFVSHDLSSVARWCDRVLLLRNGVPEMLGPPNEVIEQYGHLEVLSQVV
jgi:ABC-type polysaccharide/polyol phosphate transport system ATPase subunit